VSEALTMVDSTEDPSGQGDALLDLAEVLWLAGDTDGASRAALNANKRYTIKGNRAGLRRAQSVAEALLEGRDLLVRAPTGRHDD
jgi:hypothetical protein